MKLWIPLWALSVAMAILSSSCAPSPSGVISRQPAQAPAGEGASGGAEKAAGIGAPAAGGEKASADRMIIYDSRVSMEVKDAAETMDAIAGLARRQGGYTVNNSFRLEGERQVASVTIRVPARLYLDTLAELRRLALKVETEESKSQDVTEEFSDLGAQLRNLEATESQYLEFLKRAQTIDDVLKVQARISETRREIERIKGRLVYLERTTDMASITVSFFTRTRPKADPKEGLPAWWAKTTAAFEQSLVFLGNMATVIGVAVAFSWWLIILAAVGTFLWRKIGFRRAPPPPPDGKGD